MLINFYQQKLTKIIKDYMVFKYKGVEVFYNYQNNGKSKTLVLLHGWGRSSQDFNDFLSFDNQRNYLVVDFPPFGQSGSNLQDWNIYTYVSILISLCDHLKIDSADFLGHSFGGRIVIILACVKRSLVHSCILVNSAGMKPKRSVLYKLANLNFKFKRILGLKVKDRSSVDYKQLSPNMKETFKSIVNNHLENYAKHMQACTLIVWGEKDKETPLYMAKRLNKKIKGSTLKVLKNAGHFSFLECPLEFFGIVNEFLNNLD